MKLSKCVWMKKNKTIILALCVWCVGNANQTRLTLYQEPPINLSPTALKFSPRQ